MLAILIALLIEIPITLYTISASKGNISLAMVSSGIISLSDSYIVVWLTEDHSVIPFLAVGQAIGTGIAMLCYNRFEPRKSKKRKIHGNIR